MSAMDSDPILRADLAGTAPRDLLWQQRFWRRQRPFLGIVGGAVAMLWVLAPYTYAWAGGWGMISFVVQGLAVWGVWIALSALATLEVDTALVGEMEARGAGYLVDLKAGRRAQVDLDRIEEALLPHNPGTPPPGPIRLFQHICKEARDRRFDSGSTLVQPYREESLEDVFHLQNLQKIALWLGILGTFIGLLVALQQRDPGTTADGAALGRMVDKMYGGLFVSFTASVAGLEVAIILSLLILLLRKRQERYFARLEGAVVTLLSVARHAINRDDFLAEFSQVNVAMRDLTRRVYEQTQELGDGLVKVHGELREQSERIGTGLDRLARARDDFDGFLQQVSDAEHAFLSDLGRLFEAASFNAFTCALESGVREAGTEVSLRLERLNADNSAQLTAFTGAVDVLERAVQAQSHALTAAVEALATKLSGTPVGFPSALTTELRRLSEETRMLNRSMERLSARGFPLYALSELFRAIVERVRGRRTTGYRQRDVSFSRSEPWRPIPDPASADGSGTVSGRSAPSSIRSTDG